MDISHAQHIHMIGIKGVGMTATALLLQDLGKKITGSDTGESQITDQVLADRIISVSEFASDNIGDDVDLVIYSGAYKSATNIELKTVEQKNIYSILQAQALAEIVADKKVIAVCGVGGKTTTSAMIASVFAKIGQGGWFVGSSSFNDGVVPGKIDESDWFVLEADEYAISPGEDNNPKFSLYSPQIIICTNLAFDHPDIYTDFEHTLDTFAEFFNKLPDHGKLIIKSDDLALISSRLKPSLPIISLTSQAQIPELELSVIGDMNQVNASFAYTVSQLIGIDETQARQALSHFSGTKRRQELIATQDDVIYMDDYAHHPLEVASVLRALKETYHQRRLLVVFHLHTLSRTKALLPEFVASLAPADLVLLPPIFTSEREIDDQSVTHQDLAQLLRQHNQEVVVCESFDEVVEKIRTIRKPQDLVLTLGAGDIYKIHQQLLATKP